MALLRLGISACLLGEQVRHDGGHKRDNYLTETLGPDVEWVPICPEVEIGLGVPRPTIRLEFDKDRGEARLLHSQDASDLTEAMQDWGQAWLEAAGTLHGFILKKGSPSCGVQSPVYHEGLPSTAEPGIFAAAVMARGIPAIDEGRLRDPGLREHFFDQAMAWRRWHDHLASGEPLSGFQARNKFTLMSHSPDGANRLGRLAAEEDVAGYQALLPEVLAQRATRGRHANVLAHAQGFLEMDMMDRREMTAVLDDYRNGLVPLLVPLTLLRHHARDAPAWLRDQTYLEPYPKEWMLRGHI